MRKSLPHKAFCAIASGKAEVCKISIPGPIPGGASKTKSSSQELLFVLEMKRADAHEK